VITCRRDPRDLVAALFREPQSAVRFGHDRIGTDPELCSFLVLPVFTQTGVIQRGFKGHGLSLGPRGGAFGGCERLPCRFERALV
jgi:hypothetical protein